MKRAVLLLLLIFVIPVAGMGQEAESGANRFAREFALKAGLGSYATGDDHNCGSALAWSVGGEVQFSREWVATLSGEILSGESFACTLLFRREQLGSGRFAHEDGGIQLNEWTPRVGAMLGRNVHIANWSLVPGLKAALQRSPVLFSDEERVTHPWGGVELRVGLAGGRFSLSIEQGWNRAPIQQEIFREPDDPRQQPERVGSREIHRWEPSTFVFGRFHF